MRCYNLGSILLYIREHFSPEAQERDEKKINKTDLRPCDQDRYNARPQVKRPTSIKRIGALFRSPFSTPLAKVVFASLLGGDKGGT